MALKLVSVLLLPAVKAMNGNRGRMVVQGSHALLHALWDSERRFPEVAAAYKAQGSAFKIVLVADDEATLLGLHESYRRTHGVTLVEERGTRASGGNNEAVRGLTGVGIGPIDDAAIGDDLGSLRPFL
jgi:peptidyl-tRNA hydrolase